MNKNYVLGFLFSEDKQSVVLILKNRPKLQAGFLNGVGGKSVLTVIESPLQAIIREFYEETGLYFDKWEKFCEYNSSDFNITVFKGFGDVSTVKTTDEIVFIAEVNNLPDNIMTNLHWLIPMALENDYYIVELL